MADAAAVEFDQHDPPGWARDMVLTELRRHPDGLEKDKLQELTGIGPGDLRATIERLELDGVVAATDDGWALDPDGEDAAADAAGRAAEAADGGFIGQDPDFPPRTGQDAPDSGVGAAAQAMGLTAASGPVRARIVVDVMYHPEEGDDLVGLGMGWAALAAGAVKAEHPDLQVADILDSIDIFDSPRRVWPRQQPDAAAD